MIRVKGDPIEKTVTYPSKTPGYAKAMRAALTREMGPPVTKNVTENTDVTKKRGRPRKAVVLSGAERVRAYRARRKGET